jgi:hypothetical protein
LPWSRKPTPPNIFFSSMFRLRTRASRMRLARDSLNGTAYSCGWCVSVDGPSYVLSMAGPRACSEVYSCADLWPGDRGVAVTFNDASAERQGQVDNKDFGLAGRVVKSSAEEYAPCLAVAHNKASRRRSDSAHAIRCEHDLQVTTAGRAALEVATTSRKLHRGLVPEHAVWLVMVVVLPPGRRLNLCRPHTLEHLLSEELVPQASRSRCA